MSTDPDTAHTAEAIPAYTGRLSMDITAIDSTGHTLMTSATALRHELTTATTALRALLDEWTAPAATEAAEAWTAASTAADRWLDHMHGLGSLAREMAGSTDAFETRTAREFRESGRKSAAIAEEFRRRRQGIETAIDTPATEAAERHIDTAIDPTEGDPA